MTAGKCVSGLPRRSICRSCRSVPIDWGSDVSSLFLRCSSRKRHKCRTESGNDVSRLSDALSSIRLTMPEIDSGPQLEGVLADVQIAQLLQPLEGRRQRG